MQSDAPTIDRPGLAAPTRSAPVRDEPSAGAATAPNDDAPPLALNARRLLLIRTIMIPGPALALALTGPMFGFNVTVRGLLEVAGAILLLNGFLWWRTGNGRHVGNRSLCAQILADLLGLTAILLVTGGPTNPMVVFYLLLLVIAAAILPRRYVWVVGLASVAGYSVVLLLRQYGLESPRAAELPPTLGVFAMWLGFVVMTAVIAWSVTAMAETVRQRDRALARAREMALRDEQLMAVAALAAGAAHELSTPLATMAVVTSELARQLPPDAHPDTGRQLALLRAQIARCKEALSVLSASAGAARADRVEQVSSRQFVGRAVDEVRRLRPGAQVKVAHDAADGPLLTLDRRAYQALLNVLNNAVDASPTDVAVASRWTATGLEIAVADRGGGFAQATTQPRPGVSTKAGGLGLGLFLTQAVLTQLGGELVTEANAAGGTTVRLRLATHRPANEAADRPVDQP